MIARIAAGLLAVLLTGCQTTATKQLRFVEAPYCTVSADRVQYRFQAGPEAAASLTAAARRWSASEVHLTSREAVEFNCLRSVLRALESAGMTADYRMDGGGG